MYLLGHHTWSPVPERPERLNFQKQSRGTQHGESGPYLHAVPWFNTETQKCPHGVLLNHSCPQPLTPRASLSQFLPNPPSQSKLSSPLLQSHIIPSLATTEPKIYHPNYPNHLRCIPELLLSWITPLFPAPGPKSVCDQTNESLASQPERPAPAQLPSCSLLVGAEQSWSPLWPVCIRRGLEF